MPNRFYYEGVSAEVPAEAHSSEEADRAPEQLAVSAGRGFERAIQNALNKYISEHGRPGRDETVVFRIVSQELRLSNPLWDYVIVVEVELTKTNALSRPID